MENEIRELRNKLIDYYGTAMSFYPASMIDLNKVYLMGDEEVIEEALNLGFITYSDGICLTKER